LFVLGFCPMRYPWMQDEDAKERAGEKERERERERERSSGNAR